MRIVLDGVLLDVEYDYQKPVKGTKDRFGVPLTPDDPESVEITEVWLDDNDLTDLLRNRHSEIEMLVLAKMVEERDAA